jgi:hypothetical protein
LGGQKWVSERACGENFHYYKSITGTGPRAGAGVARSRIIYIAESVAGAGAATKCITFFKILHYTSKRIRVGAGAALFFLPGAGAESK